MIWDEIKKSVKQKSEDFQSNPFMSSFIISWIILNHKYLLILFSDEKLDAKLRHLNTYLYHPKTIDIMGFPIWKNEFFYPLIFAVGYVFFYPVIQIIFDSVTVVFKMISTHIKDNISGIDSRERVIKEQLKDISILKEDQENLINEKSAIKENLRLTKVEHERKIEEFEKISSEEIQKRDKKIEDITQILKEKSKENKNHKDEIEEYKKEALKNIKTINSQSEKINNLNNEIEKIKTMQKNDKIFQYGESDKLNIINNQSETIKKLKEENEDMKNKINKDLFGMK